MKILFITEVSPFPSYGGERLRCTGLLKALSALGNTITAIVTNDDAINLEEYPIEGVNFIEYNFQKRNSNNLKKVLSNFRMDKNLLDLIEKQNVDIVFIDYFFLGQYISYFHKKNIPVIYGTHNAQSFLSLQDISGNLPNKFRKSLLYLIHYIHERLYFPKANVLIVVSTEDKNYYGKFVKNDKITIIPNFIDLKDYRVDVAKKNYLVISGNFYSFQNRIGTIWFIEKVWNSSLSEKTELLLAGKGSVELLQHLDTKKHVTNIKASGEVENIKPFIAAATASIVPLLQGSGSRLKCIEAMALKTQLISTKLGVEGIEHKGSILIADKPADFQKQILRVLDDQVNNTGQAYEICKKHYSPEAIKRTLLNITSKLIKDK